MARCPFVSGVKTRVLIIDSDQAHADSIARGLERRNYATVITSHETALAEPVQIRKFDVVIIEISLNRRTDWALLQKTSALAVTALRRPVFVALSNVYRGPELRLRLERRGIRLLYERRS